MRLIIQIMEEAKFYNLVPLVKYLHGSEWRRFDSNNCSSRIALFNNERLAKSLEDSIWGSVCMVHGDSIGSCEISYYL